MTFTYDQWRGVYLFTTCVFNREQIYRSTPIEIDFSQMFPVTRHNVLGHWMGWQQEPSNIRNCSRRVQTRIYDYFFNRAKFSEFVADQFVIKLRPRFVKYLIESGRYSKSYKTNLKYNIAINELMDDICPPWQERRELYSEYVRPHCLYFEPCRELVSNMGPLERDLQAMKDEAERFFGVNGTLERPVQLQDVLLLPAPGYGNHEKSCLAIRHGPLSDDSGWHLPLVPRQFTEHVALCAIKHRLGNKLRSLPVGGDTFWSMYEKHSRFTDYAKKFIQNRAQAEVAIREAEEADLALETLFSTSHVYSHSGEGVYRFSDEPLITNYLSTPIHEIYRRDRVRADAQLRESVSLITARLERLTSFLRDSASTDLAEINLKISKRLGQFTLLMFLLGLLGIAIGLLTDSTKVEFCNYLQLRKEPCT